MVKEKQLVPGAALINPTVCFLSVVLPTIHIIRSLLCGYLTHFQPHHKSHLPHELKVMAQAVWCPSPCCGPHLMKGTSPYNTLGFCMRRNCNRLLPHPCWWTIYVEKYKVCYLSPFKKRDKKINLSDVLSVVCGPLPGVLWRCICLAAIMRHLLFLKRQCFLTVVDWVKSLNASSNPTGTNFCLAFVWHFLEVE